MPSQGADQVKTKSQKDKEALMDDQAPMTTISCASTKTPKEN